MIIIILISLLPLRPASLLIESFSTQRCRICIPFSYSFVINILEKPFIGGRGALVSVEIDDKKIFEFQARPDEEMLQKAADYALKRIENYNKTRNTFEKIY